ncbi:MAG: ABC transporter ATP-binding protein [Chloroflexota bacterium]|nr:ABC transporter ATP-binding protein [Chloroflexota bacterium]
MEAERQSEHETTSDLQRRIDELQARLSSAADHRKPAVVTSGLSKVYGRGATRVVALRGVNLRVGRGEFVAVVGASGSGKTTLLNMLGALDRPTRGRVYIDGVETSRVPESMLYRVRRDKLGFIFQTYYLVPTLTAIQNVLTPVLPLGADGQYQGRAEALLKMVGLRKRMHHRPGELSGGEQQRVAIARALILNPGVVLADEPTGNLDSTTAAGIMRLLHWLNEERGKTFIVVTHDADIASGADRAVYLRDGRLSDAPPA